jgi:hypothetical protein
VQEGRTALSLKSIELAEYRIRCDQSQVGSVFCDRFRVIQSSALVIRRIAVRPPKGQAGSCQFQEAKGPVPAAREVALEGNLRTVERPRRPLEASPGEQEFRRSTRTASHDPPEEVASMSYPHGIEETKLGLRDRRGGWSESVVDRKSLRVTRRRTFQGAKPDSATEPKVVAHLPPTATCLCQAETIP